MSPINVLYLSDSGDLAGGGELSLLELVEALPASSVNPLVVCPGEGALPAGLRARGIQVEVLRFPDWRRARLFALAPALSRLAALVRRHRISLIHVNSIGRMTFYAGLVGRWRGVPVLWHVRVGDSGGWRDRILARLVTRIVVNSDAVARRFSGCPGARVTRIHNGVDLGRFTPGPPPPDLRAALGLPPGAPVVGSVGRFVAYKGYDHLLDAAQLAQEKIPEAHWVLVGDGGLRGALEEQRRALGLERVVHFAGWQPRVAEHLALFDLFALPSLGEHFGRVLLEAMAMAKAVVATDAGGVPEIVLDGETGLLVPPADPAAIAEAVVTLLQDPVRAARMGEAGRRRVAAEFSLSRHVEAVEALYREVRGAGRGGL